MKTLPLLLKKFSLQNGITNPGIQPNHNPIMPPSLRLPTLSSSNTSKMVTSISKIIFNQLLLKGSFLPFSFYVQSFLFHGYVHGSMIIISKMDVQYLFANSKSNGGIPLQLNLKVPNKLLRNGYKNIKQLLLLIIILNQNFQPGKLKRQLFLPLLELRKNTSKQYKTLYKAKTRKQSCPNPAHLTRHLLPFPLETIMKMTALTFCHLSRDIKKKSISGF